MIFICKNCGGTTVYDPDVQKMHCSYCDGLDSEEIRKSEQMSACPSCGAPVEAGEVSLAKKCNNCGNYIIFDERVEGESRPHLILPFMIGREKMKELLQQEFRKKVFMPDSFLSERKLQTIEGIYVPFWLYDLDTDMEYEGKGTSVRVWNSGDMEYTETSFYSVNRKMKAEFTRVPVDASLNMEDGIMDLMEPYDYSALSDFKEKYLSGFLGEKYGLNAEELEKRASEKAQLDTENLLNNSIQGYQSVTPVRKDFRTNIKIKEYALMPVWKYDYQYRGKQYLFHINGQTGKIIGDVPISLPKAIVYSLTVFLGCGALIQLVLSFLGVL